MTLTYLEGEMVKWLVQYGKIAWLYTKPNETKALNRLVKKGVVVYDEKLRQWTMKEQNR